MRASHESSKQSQHDRVVTAKLSVQSTDTQDGVQLIDRKIQHGWKRWWKNGGTDGGWSKREEGRSSGENGEELV